MLKVGETHINLCRCTKASFSVSLTVSSIWMDMLCSAPFLLPAISLTLSGIHPLAKHSFNRLLIDNSRSHPPSAI